MDNEQQHFQVGTDGEGKERLDVYLNEQLPQTTRSQIKKWIKQGLVRVNKAIPSVHRFLKPGDVVTLQRAEAPSKAPVPKIPVLIETDDYVVINKPAGVLTHPTEHGHPTPCVTDWLQIHAPQAADIGDKHRPGIVHRLDRDTSGVLVIAKTPEMFDWLKKQFHDRLVEKTYLALVHGHLAHQSGTIDKPIGRSKQHGRMAARTEEMDEKDRTAVTDYEVVQSYKHEDLVRAFPKTGRTHQIRVHLQSIGHPVVGDPLYKLRGQKTATALGRQFLHAAKLSFTDLSGEKITAEAPLPQELQTYLSTRPPYEKA